MAQYSANFALVLLIVEETGQALYSSLLVLALVVPSTVFGIIAGVAADHLPRRGIILLFDLCRALVCIAFIRYGGGVASFYAVAVGLSLAGEFSNTSMGAMGPMLVDRTEFARANAINQAVGGVAQLTGLGILTPIALRLFDSPDTLFAICAGLFVVSALQAVAIGRVRRIHREEVGSAADAGRFWTVGWRALRKDRLTWHAAVELTLISTTLIILGGLIPTFIREVLDLPVDIGALILSPAVVGVGLGLRVASFLAHRISHAILSTFGFATFVVLLLALAFVNQEADFLAGYGAFAWLADVNIGNFDGGGLMAMAVMVPLGFSYAIVVVAAQTLINDRVPLQLLGRVGATQGAMAAIASSAPVLVAGVLADVVGVVPVMAVVAALIGAAAVANIRQKPASETPVGAAGT